MNIYTISGKKNKVANRYNYSTYETSKKNLIAESMETLSEAAPGAMESLQSSGVFRIYKRGGQLLTSKKLQQS